MSTCLIFSQLAGLKTRWHGFVSFLNNTRVRRAIPSGQLISLKFPFVMLNPGLRNLAPTDCNVASWTSSAMIVFLLPSCEIDALATSFAKCIKSISLIGLLSSCDTKMSPSLVSEAQFCWSVYVIAVCSGNLFDKIFLKKNLWENWRQSEV